MKCNFRNKYCIFYMILWRLQSYSERCIRKLLRLLLYMLCLGPTAVRWCDSVKTTYLPQVLRLENICRKNRTQTGVGKTKIKFVSALHGTSTALLYCVHIYNIITDFSELSKTMRPHAIPPCGSCRERVSARTHAIPPYDFAGNDFCAHTLSLRVVSHGRERHSLECSKAAREHF